MNLSEQAQQLYQTISNKYDKNRFHPHRRYIVNPNMIHHWERIFAVEKSKNETPPSPLLKSNIHSSVDEKKLMVLNLGCGSGNDSWILFNRFEPFIHSLVAIDLSSDMIKLANKSKDEMESSFAKKIPIEFLVGDVMELQKNEELKKVYSEYAPSSENPENMKFDFVTACHLLHYSSDFEELCKMCSSISEMVKPGGTFLTLNSNPFLNSTQIDPNQQKLGVYRSKFMTAEEQGRSQMVNGDQFEISIDLNYNEFDQNENFIVRIQNRYFTPESYEKALKLAGFSKVEFHMLWLDESELSSDNPYGRGSSSMNVCSAIVIEATK